MLSTHLTCLLLLFCFAQSKPAENDEASTKGMLWKISKEAGNGNRNCFCGNIRLPNYDKGIKDYRRYEKDGGTQEDYTDFEQTKSKMGRKKCLCFKINSALEKGVSGYERIEGETLYKPIGENSYQIDRYEDMTDKPGYLSPDGYLVKKNDINFVRKQREKRSSEMDKLNGRLMKLDEQLKDDVGALVKEAEDVVSHNRNKSAEALDKASYGLGLASDVVQQVGDRVGSMMGGQMAKTVLDQVSFGLGLASNAAQSAAENKRNNSGRKKRSIHHQSNAEKTFEKMSSAPRISGEGFIQMWRRSRVNPHHQTVNTMMMKTPAVQSHSSSYSTKSSAGLKS